MPEIQSETPARTTTTPASPRLTRRRLLASAGVVAVGAIATGGARLITQPTGAASTPPAAGASPSSAAAATDQAAKPATPGPRRQYRSRPDLAAPLIEPTTVAGIPADGLVFLTPANGAGKDGPMIVGRDGEPVWLGPNTAPGATSLRATVVNGKPVLTWWEGDNNAGIGVGEHVVMDAGYREIARIRAGRDRKADLHELLLTNRGTALIFAVAAVEPPGGSPSIGAASQVMDWAIQEVDLRTHDVVWEWHSIDHVGVDESVSDAPTESGKVYDYFHGNSIDEDDDGNLILSARNTSAVYKLDRGSGEVIRRLGGKKSDFTLGPGAAFALQHDARRQPDGTLTIFDDANAPGPSRGIVLKLDEPARTAELVREYIQPDKLYSTSQGNLQMLPNGHVFIGWGSVPRFSEFTSDGTLLLDAGFTASQSYRNERFRWSGRPAQPPALAVDALDGGLVAYASWNGATDVAAWDVLAGPSDAKLRKVASTPRRGFETLIAVPALRPGDRVVAVRAVDASRKRLGVSPAVRVPA